MVRYSGVDILKQIQRLGKVPKWQISSIKHSRSITCRTLCNNNIMVYKVTGIINNNNTLR